MIELTKPQKKIARQLIRLALLRECETFLDDTRRFLHEAESNGEDAHTNYLSLFKKVNNFDRHIARHYDGMSGSRYLITVLNRYCAGTLTDEDITLLGEDTQKYLSGMKKTLMEE